MTDKRQESSNEGIVAKEVNAEVLAVGYRASAVKQSATSGEAGLDAAVAELRQAIDHLEINDTVRKALAAQVSQMQNTGGREEKSGFLKTITKHLTVLGELGVGAAGAIEAARKIAGLLH